MDIEKLSENQHAEGVGCKAGPSDTALADAIRQGDTRAFQLFYDRFYLRLLVQLKLLSTDFQLAEDICQDAFVRLWEKRESIDPSKSLQAYLRKIAHHLFVDLKRKQQLQQVWNQERATEPCLEETVLENLYHKELNDKLQEALQLLPEEKQQIFRLSREQQLSYKEIAQLENTTPKAIERHMARTNAFLKRYLREYTDLAYLFVVGLFLGK
ncbi:MULTISPECIES: RNA polymerase sigma factor [Olivibacter]|uniref:RNA polymerase sigma factor n=1 Tax=Olivibacter jilunii TaxID=985016 RepID=A0ABW6B8U5_9SPHI|nr:sigma-70 family RNA polymerase sigma factor [Olivibacter sp. 47]MCL4642111.1 sigma-70 family RNA polymerase sigma factor [Olivibacter sp. UJ_SKK_5.1]MDM8176640.1 sigma-70 family RNA polymerase sigma factor [Olivibacter sp. 47]MDX3912782.1 sigma-70 family RNA polymerase sigma factor [Pseudosphingobacterium sp.]